MSFRNNINLLCLVILFCSSSFLYRSNVQPESSTQKYRHGRFTIRKTPLSRIDLNDNFHIDVSPINRNDPVDFHHDTLIYERRQPKYEESKKEETSKSHFCLDKRFGIFMHEI